MIVNKVPYEANKTRSVADIGLQPTNDIIEQLNKRWPYPEYSSKTVYKTVFGKQLMCVNYTFRNWVWTFSDPNNGACLNVLCSESGAHMEYRIGSRQTAIKDLIAQVMDKIIDFPKEGVDK